jgi:hypothetical protein
MSQKLWRAAQQEEEKKGERKEGEGEKRGERGELCERH